MRLTLRTLLAYLDDTLDANEIKEIGLKVSESDDAQELVARIKQVTRRRRLTAPTGTGPNAFDPNDVSEYLDNVLDAERVKEVEKVCLENDLHLAEIAACHQILTLVLGEPALVPPKSKERMYGLVQGREAIPFRKAVAPRKDAEALEDEETLGLGGGWLRWVLPAAAVLLVSALGLAIYQILPPRKAGPSVASADRKELDKEKDRGNSVPEKDKTKSPEPDDKGKTEPNGKAAKDGEKEKGTDKLPVPGGADKEAEKGPPEAGVKRATAPDKARVVLANYQGGISGQPTFLAARPAGTDKWQKVGRGGVVSSSDTLLAPPGFTGALLTKTGVGILLRGHLREFSIDPIWHTLLAESTVVLHRNPDFDLDLTLLRGRVFLSNRKDQGPVKVRLRFEEEVWDLTLAVPGTEVGIDLSKVYTPEVNYRADEEPRAVLFLCLFKGECEVKVDAFQSYGIDAEPPKAAMMMWDSFGKASAPRRLDAVPPIWSKVHTAAALPEANRKYFKQLEAALKGLEGQLADARSVELPIKETLTRPDPFARVVAIQCLGALDQMDRLIEVLGDENPEHGIDRATAVFTLRRWITRSAAQGKELYDPKTKGEGGLLLERKFRPGEAETIYDLLHDFRLEDWGKPETFEALARGLQHPRVAIAELAYFHLLQLARGAKLPGPFNAALPREERENYAKQIRALVAAKKLPPPPPEKPPEKSAPSPGPKVKD